MKILNATKFKPAFGKALCNSGLHYWGPKESSTHPDWFFGMGHPAQKCQRPGCKFVRRFAPS